MSIALATGAAHPRGLAAIRCSGDHGRALGRSLYDRGMDAGGPIILFDTDCVLCSSMVAFVLARESAPVLRFAGAWSEEGLALAARHGLARQDLNDTFAVIDGSVALLRSDAGMIVLRHLRAPWRWLAVLRLVPRPLRDAVYGFVARRRYRWFGQRSDCTVVPADQRHRFIGVRGRPATS
ncbi:thiol-disulfide oxidoreductase DCC family protein [Neoroseomonas terrae]|nr:DCC1-like thiol-disulfide oxidoreductase family protein [Neoroseomonas terrae]